MKTTTKSTTKVVVAILAAMVMFFSSMGQAVLAIYFDVQQPLVACEMGVQQAVEEISNLQRVIIEENNKNKKEAQTTAVTTVATTTTTTTTTVTTEQKEYFIFKPDTHYVHTVDCYWTKCGDTEKIENTEGIEVRLCDECNPNIEVMNEYVEPTESPTEVYEETYIETETQYQETEAEVIEEVAPTPSGTSLSDYEYTLLCKLVASEYGGMGSTIERAKIVAAVMNQVERYGDSIETCIYRSCVPWGFNPNNEYFCGVHYSSMCDAVDYYFAYGTAGFYDSGYWEEGADSWWGDGYYNHFYRA